MDNFPQVREEEARAAIRELHLFLSSIPVSAPDHSNASRAASLVTPFLTGSMNDTFCAGLCGTLSKGIGDWHWTDATWQKLGPLISAAGDKTCQHVYAEA